ncbi:MAG: methionyl-tRNA formyltransferase [Lachnospiraceae bacterium]|nr:methionyl-tRNA formyltransferase [Lachnospiraceae bacterium]
MKIVFMGTPDFAASPLEALVEAGYEVVLAVTQPDREKGRGKALSMSPVKECALKYGIPVFQPVKIRMEEAVSKLREYEADLFVVAAFGQILSREILEMPRLGCVNIHASLLPKYRGASPIQWAILNGEEKTGITIMRMDEGVDTGDILYRKEIRIEKEETGGSLFDKLTKLGADALLEALPGIENGSLKGQAQEEAEATHVGKIEKEMGRIDWGRKASLIERSVRGLNPWPSAYTTIRGKTLKIWKSREANMTDVSENVSGSGLSVKEERPGCVLSVTKNEFTVLTGEGALMVLEVQLEGKKRMSVHDFLLGFELAPGIVLGTDR